MGEILSILQNTEFTVTDRSNFQNTGVGAADRSSDGSAHKDTINYIAIIGDSTRTGYADPIFTDNSGMHGLVLHELAHMTQAGDNFFNRSIEIWRADPTKVEGSSFYPTDYSRNVEAYANELMTQLSTVININLYGFRPGTSAPPITPEAIYQAHTGQPYPGP